MSLDQNSLLSIARIMLTDENGVSAMFPFAAVTTVDINSEKVFKGVAFGASKRVAIPATPGVFSIVIDPTAVTKDALVLLPMIFKAYGAGPVNIDIYAGGTYGTDGTLIDCFNRNGKSQNTCETIIRTNPTITDKGTKLPTEFVIFSNGVPAVATIGGEAVDSLITVMSTNTLYLVELANQDSVSALGWFGLSFFEVNEGE